MKLGLWLIFLFYFTSTQAVKQYNGYKVYKLNSNSQNNLEKIKAKVISSPEFDLWHERKENGFTMHVMVAPKVQRDFIEDLKKSNIQFETMIEDFEGLFNNESIEGKSKPEMNWTDYHDLEAIYKWLDKLSKDHRNVEIIKGGSSYENRTIKGVKISFGPEKRGVYIEGGIHAREWISPATVTYLINALVNNKDSRFRKIAESFDWYLFPSINPDGYVYTFTEDRLWRKNRTPYSHCYGADENRNWDMHWMEIGATTNPCDEINGGPRPFSEIETLTLSQFIKTIGSKLDVALAFHSYGQHMLLPYAHTIKHLENYDDVMTIGKAAVAALSARYNTTYDIGNVQEVIYPCSGLSTDWIKYNFKTPIVLTYELRDRETYGFVLPKEQIIPNCLEVLDSIIAMFEEAEKLGYFRLG